MHSLKLLGNNLSARALLRYGELRHSPGDAGGLEQCANPARNPLFLPPSLPPSLALSLSLPLSPPSCLLPPPSSLTLSSLLSPLSSLLSLPVFFCPPCPCFSSFLVSFFSLFLSSFQVAASARTRILNPQQNGALRLSWKVHNSNNYHASALSQLRIYEDVS